MLKMKRILPYLLLLFLLGCSKEEKSYEHWSKLASEKYKEIVALTQSVHCTEINDFETVQIGHNYLLLHPSIKGQYGKLMQEYEYLQTQAGKAAGREGILNDIFAPPNPPVRKQCQNGKPTLIFAQNLTLEEARSELSTRLAEIKAFYNDVTCTNANDWSAYGIRTGCCIEAIAIHKTIKTVEFIQKIDLYNRIMEQKMTLEKVSCAGIPPCANSIKSIQCVDGKPVIEMAKL